MVMLRKGAVKAGPISLIFDIARFEGVQMTIFFLSRLKNRDLNIAIHRIHKWRTRGKKLVPSHESEALEDKQKLQMKTFSETCRVFSTDST